MNTIIIEKIFIHQLSHISFIKNFFAETPFTTVLWFGSSHCPPYGIMPLYETQRLVCRYRSYWCTTEGAGPFMVAKETSLIRSWIVLNQNNKNWISLILPAEEEILFLSQLLLRALWIQSECRFVTLYRCGADQKNLKSVIRSNLLFYSSGKPSGFLLIIPGRVVHIVPESSVFIKKCWNLVLHKNIISSFLG